MITASRSGTLPATEPEVRAIEVRDHCGQLVRKIDRPQATELVKRGYGEWRRASNGRDFVMAYLSPGASRGCLSRNGSTIRKRRIWNKRGEAMSAPTIVEHRETVEH